MVPHFCNPSAVEGRNRKVLRASWPHQPGSEFRERPCVAGIRQKVIEQVICHPSLSLVFTMVVLGFYIQLSQPTFRSLMQDPITCFPNSLIPSFHLPVLCAFAITDFDSIHIQNAIIHCLFLSSQLSFTDIENALYVFPYVCCPFFKKTN